jgi:16S rRNA (guanine527-N7)-methyltransferase
MKFYDIINIACQKDGLNFDTDQYHKFMLYKDLIQDWNNKINLTAITEDDEIVKKHFIDCIKCFRFEDIRTSGSIIDVGTGAGFPGIPIKIMAPNKKVTLLDSLNKRVNFLNEVITSLKLNNVEAIHGRAEEMSRKEEYREKFDIAISRAVANMSVLSELCIPYVKVGGYFVAMKGPAVEEELSQARNAIGTLGGKLEQVIKVEIEETDLQHNLVVIKKVRSTPQLYPRKATSISKKPLK